MVSRDDIICQRGGGRGVGGSSSVIHGTEQCVHHAQRVHRSLLACVVVCEPKAVRERYSSGRTENISGEGVCVGVCECVRVFVCVGE